jgi:hypothetical protein
MKPSSKYSINSDLRFLALKEYKNTYRTFVLKPEGKIPFGPGWYKREDSVTIHLEE